MYEHAKPETLKTNDKVIHCGTLVEVADIAIEGWFVNIATMCGGRVSFQSGKSVRIIRRKKVE
ncbi:MAG: hypothetical protein ACRC2Y_04365 [Aeromonas veronii]